MRATGLARRRRSGIWDAWARSSPRRGTTDEAEQSQAVPGHRAGRPGHPDARAADGIVAAALEAISVKWSCASRKAAWGYRHRVLSVGTLQKLASKLAAGRYGRAPGDGRVSSTNGGNGCCTAWGTACSRLRKRQEGTVHPDRNESVYRAPRNRRSADRLSGRRPITVISWSDDRTKKDAGGEPFATCGTARPWGEHRRGDCRPTSGASHDLPSAFCGGEGDSVRSPVFDDGRRAMRLMGQAVGCDHDTPTFNGGCRFGFTGGTRIGGQGRLRA